MRTPHNEGAQIEVDAALVELLDHLGEEVAVGIVLPGGVPWAGGQGVLKHEARELMELARSNDGFYYSDEEHQREEDRHWAGRMLQLKDWTGRFRVGDFSVPLSGERVVSARPTSGLPHAGLDFEIAAEGHPGLKVRVTFLEHAAREEKD